MMSSESLKKMLKNIPMPIWILLAIIVVGVFFRVYHFREWLYFYPDQARDITIVEDYLTGKSELPLLGFIAASTKFQLGAMYYYFQMISGELFGIFPQTMAYPDVFFNILSIPLLYYFLRRIFKIDISLVLTGLYTISYYAIEFSRFAWNPNPIPFFVLLFLLSMTKFLSEKEQTKWKWIAGIGITLGIGIQLHTILLYLLSAVTFVCFVFLLKEKRMVWKQCLTVVVLAIVFNANQILSESRHNMANTKTLIKLSTKASSDNERLYDFSANIVCHAQANAHILSSFGNKEDCDFLKVIARSYKKGFNEITRSGLMLFGIAISMMFSLVGYGLMIRAFRREEVKERKIFLGLLFLYMGFSFLIIFPVIAGAPLRYYLQLFFVPFMLLGFIFEYIRSKYAEFFMVFVIAACLLVVILNFSSLLAEAKLYAAKNHSRSNYVVLGELENMRDYILGQMENSPKIYMMGKGEYMQNYYKPIEYIFSKENVTIARELKVMANIPVGAKLFAIEGKGDGTKTQINGFPVLSYKNFGEIGIYILNTQK